MQAYQQAHGQRILDFLDLYYYPAAPDVALADAGDEATQALRLRSARSLWDPTYGDQSRIAGAGPENGIVQLIPHMRAWVSANYPGTKLAITKYNWGAPGHINGALAQADVLGIFGREGLHLTTLWSPPESTQPVAFAFRMFRNYNRTGGKFGETSIKSVSSDQSRLAIYATEEAATGALTPIVIKKATVTLSAPLTLKNFAPTGVVQGWRYSASPLTKIVRLADQTFTGPKFTVRIPANSITLYRTGFLVGSCDLMCYVADVYIPRKSHPLFVPGRFRRTSPPPVAGPILVTMGQFEPKPMQVNLTRTPLPLGPSSRTVRVASRDRRTGVPYQADPLALAISSNCCLVFGAHITKIPLN